MIEVVKHFVSRSEDRKTVASACVNLREIHVAGDGFAEMPKQDFAKNLRHYIGKMFLRGDWEYLDRPVFNVFTQEVVVDVDVFGSFHSGVVFSDLDGGAIVFVDDTRLLDVDAHGAQQHVDPDYLFDCHAEGQVLSVTGVCNHDR